jgi:hypothetical protein
MMVLDVPAAAMLNVEAIKVDPFAARFENWRRWCVAHGHYQRRSASLEGVYSGPQGKGHPSGWGDWEESAPPRGTVLVPINIPDALEVNRAYTRLALLAPTYARAIQVLVFQPWLRPQRQAQMLGTHYQRLDFLLDRAKKMLRNQLRAS